jgi:prepilin-type N-terminal cleavage/methylation domain-containing protein/prepilin-type processing-associated H-X9-DG protein
LPQRIRERNRSGFSIIEILVVCAALAILAAILMPVFNTAKKMSCRAQCANNLRQFATAFSLYSHDWNGYWPCPGGLRGDWSYWAQTGSGGLQSYLPGRGVKSVWCCPLVKDWNGLYSPRSYSMNSYLRTPIDKEFTENSIWILRGVDVCRLTRSAKTVLLYEGRYLADDSNENLTYIYRCANWGCVAGYGEKVVKTDRPWHGRLNNYLYCDGHVVTRRPGLYTTGDLSTYSEMYEWYVDKAYFESMPRTKKLPR